MGNVRFDISHIDRYAIITEPCTVVLKATYKVSSQYIMDGHPRWLIPLRALTNENLEALKELYRIGDVYYSDIRDLFMVGALWSSQVEDEQDLPMAGEKVIATFDYVEDILRCTGINLIPRKEPEVFLASEYISEMFDEFKNLIDEIDE